MTTFEWNAEPSALRHGVVSLWKALILTLAASRLEAILRALREANGVIAAAAGTLGWNVRRKLENAHTANRCFVFSFWKVSVRHRYAP
jgi:hypothetical protein